MTDKNAQFQGSIPEIYDRELGPVLFEPYARDLARRIDVEPGGRVLEVACGTGIVTRRLRERMPEAASLVATDLNEAMIEVARTRLADLRGVEYRVADAQELPFDDGLFAAVVCQFGIMFVPDKDKAAREARRVLARGGRFALNTWDTIENNAFMRVAHETITELFPQDPPMFYRVPFGYADPVELRALLEHNGFADVTVENVKVEARAASAHRFASGLVEGNPVSLAIQERGGTLPPVVAAIEQKLAAEFGADPIVSTFQAWVATGTKGG